MLGSRFCSLDLTSSALEPLVVARQAETRFRIYVTFKLFYNRNRPRAWRIFKTIVGRPHPHINIGIGTRPRKDMRFQRPEAIPLLAPSGSDVHEVYVTIIQYRCSLRQGKAAKPGS